MGIKIFTAEKQMVLFCVSDEDHGVYVRARTKVEALKGGVLGIRRIWGRDVKWPVTVTPAHWVYDVLVPCDDVELETTYMGDF